MKEYPSSSERRLTIREGRACSGGTRCRRFTALLNLCAVCVCVHVHVWFIDSFTVNLVFHNFHITLYHVDKVMLTMLWPMWPILCGAHVTFLSYIQPLESNMPSTLTWQLHSLAEVLIMWVQWDNCNQACDLVQYLIRGFVCRVLSALHVAVVQVVKQRHSTTQTTEANEGTSYHRLLWQQTSQVDASFSAHSDDGSQRFSIGKTQECDTPDKLIEREH